jgi:hypothetical protein
LLAQVRIETTPPRLLSVPPYADLPAGTPLLPLSGARVAYDDATWLLTATISVELDAHAGNASSWPAGTLSLGGGSAAAAGSVGAQAALTVVATGDHRVEAAVSGNLSALAARAAPFAVAPPPAYSGTGVVQLRVCSQWGECTVRTKRLHCQDLCPTGG